MYFSQLVMVKGMQDFKSTATLKPTSHSPHVDSEEYFLQLVITVTICRQKFLFVTLISLAPHDSQ